MIAGHQCAARRRRDGAARVGDFPLQLAESGDPRDGGITGQPANRLGGHGATPLELSGRRAVDPGQRVDGGRDDQLGPRAATVPGNQACTTAAADLQQGIGHPLPGGALVALRGLGIRLDRRPDDGAGVRSDLTLDPDQAAHRLADLQVAPLVRPVGFGERALGIHLVFEVLGDANELPGIHAFRGLEQHRLRFANLRGPDMFGGPGHRNRVLVADLAASQRFFRSRQLFQLPGCLQVLGRRTGGQLAMRAQPRHHAQRPVSPVAARLLEAASRLAVDRLDPVDDLATPDDRGAELAPRLLRQPAPQIPDRGLDPLEGRLAGTAHGASMRHGYDSCLS